VGGLTVDLIQQAVREARKSAIKPQMIIGRRCYGRLFYFWHKPRSTVRQMWRSSMASKPKPKPKPRPKPRPTGY
jgi:hypothetical protein